MGIFAHDEGGFFLLYNGRTLKLMLQGRVCNDRKPYRG